MGATVNTFMILWNDKELMPYWVLAGGCLSIWLLLFVRSRIPVRQRDDRPVGVQIGNGQTIGARNEQDDYFACAVQPHGVLAVLADGISGLSGGKVASTTAVETFIREFEELERFPDPEEFWDASSHEANQAILRNLLGVPGGTTLVSAMIKGRELYWGAVGDSILAVFRKGELLAINHKHTLETQLEEQYMSGEISEQEALDNPQRKRLVNYLGYDHFKQMEIADEPFALQPADKIVLCSDGVYNSLTEMELETILAKDIPPFDAAQAIIDLIEEKQLVHQDNATIIILEQGW
ncbi:PP2C family protein-serine/threonine phosphatase [Paenibacillus pabuli]|uniref:PP2C family protein-serine/threonine phosphatase n=1 Tax=Paenibacillus pabuli TaxID=1472 RepID=UPI001FE12E6D|nr:protein phosphatase 2C domain-containing protein [Paenibacillus pabuli]MEC0127808.1 protein phosphatase 2C domain-containing protein [Paenibacillus pabuli]